MDITIYHNPRCSKSRTALQLIEAAGHSPDVVLYLENPLSKPDLQALLKQADVKPSEAIRKGEAIYKELGLTGAEEEALLEAMVANPKLIERPIVVAKGGAVIARPPEKWEELL